MTLFDIDPPAPVDPLIRVRLLVAYDGTGFHGFAENPGVRTVAGTLREALERVLRHRVVLSGAGRTDRGVHAWGQVVSFATAAGLDTVALNRTLNKLVGPTIAVRAVDEVAADFDARFSATSRMYRYRVLNTPVHDPFRARYAWHVAPPLDLAAMRLATDPLIGEHDFSAFCRRPAPFADGTAPSLRRNVLTATWRPAVDGVLEFEIAAESFCHQMVRSICGTLVDVGLGRKRAGDMLAIVRSGDRARAGRVAPPEGLVLWEVGYDGKRRPR